MWRRGDERAPHRPLLVLYALGRLQAGAGRLIPFDELERPLEGLLEELGPPRARATHASEGYEALIPGLNRGIVCMVTRSPSAGGQAVESDSVTFCALCRDDHPRIKRYLTRLISFDEAEDVAQEVFPKTSKLPDRFKGE